MTTTTDRVCGHPDCHNLPARIRGVAFHTERVTCGYCGVTTTIAGYSRQIAAHACAACLWERWTRH